MILANLNQKKSGEAIVREFGDLRRYFNVKLCNSNSKITGQSSAPPITDEAQRIYQKISQKMGTGNLGGSSDSVEETEIPLSADTSETADLEVMDKFPFNFKDSQNDVIEAADFNDLEEDEAPVKASKRKRVHDGLQGAGHPSLDLGFFGLEFLDLLSTAGAS